MDLANNNIGISCGLKVKSCDNLCIEKYNNGKLYTLGGVKMIPADKISRRDY